jgi:hypothetical protein
LGGALKVDANAPNALVGAVAGRTPRQYDQLLEEKGEVGHRKKCGT